MSDELKQVGVARRDRGIFPALERTVAKRGPLHFLVHPPGQAAHQVADFRQMSGLVERVDAESPKSLRSKGLGEEVPEAGSRVAPRFSAELESGVFERACFGATHCHQNFAPWSARLLSTS